MNIVFRVDASQWIGVGHLSRCLTLALKLKDMHTVTFITEEGLAKQLISSHGFQYYTIPEKKMHSPILDVDQYISEIKNQTCEDALHTINQLNKIGSVHWLIVDHYAIDEKWHKQIRPFVDRVMVIDDLANRKYDCDLLLDQNYYEHYLTRYHYLVPEHCKLLLGPNYMLFRDEFLAGQVKRKRIREELCKVLVFYGGSDPTNETLKVLQAIGQLKLRNVHYDIVVGKLNKQKSKIKEICDQFDYVTYHEQINCMAQLMLEADLAIGAGGATTWERCILGLPAIVTILAENQQVGIQELERFGFLENIGKHEQITAQLIAEKITKYYHSSKLQVMSRSAYDFFDKEAAYTNAVVYELLHA